MRVFSWQIERYVRASISRYGVRPCDIDDCIQEVLVELIARWGRERFDRLVGEVEATSIGSTLSRGSSAERDFTRSIDAVRHRDTRRKKFRPLPADIQERIPCSARAEAIELIGLLDCPGDRDVLMGSIDGRMPREIARDLGIAPKSVSNRRSNAIRAIRAMISV